MTDNGEHIIPHEALQQSKAPWPTPQYALEYRRSIIPDDTSPDYSRNLEFVKTFGQIIDILPKHDLTFAIELYSLLATEEAEDIRKQVAQYIPCLYAKDREAGEALYMCLVNDYESDLVREHAYDSIEKGITKGLVPAHEHETFREAYYDACDRAAIRNGQLKPRLITDTTIAWKEQVAPWQVSIETAVAYITDLETKQRNAREEAAYQNFFTKLQQLPFANPSLAGELAATLAAHPNRDVRKHMAAYCSKLYHFNKAAAIHIANILQLDEDEEIATSVKLFFAYAINTQGYDYDEVMRFLNPPRHTGRPNLRLVHGGKTDISDTQK